jgi:hypothetical protein
MIVRCEARRVSRQAGGVLLILRAKIDANTNQVNCRFIVRVNGALLTS